MPEPTLDFNLPLKDSKRPSTTQDLKFYYGEVDLAISMNKLQ